MERLKNVIVILLFPLISFVLDDNIGKAIIPNKIN